MALFGLPIPPDAFFEAVLWQLEVMAIHEEVSAQDVLEEIGRRGVEDAVRQVVGENQKGVPARRSRLANTGQPIPSKRISSGDVRTEFARLVSGGRQAKDSERADLVFSYLLSLLAQRLDGNDVEINLEEIGKRTAASASNPRQKMPNAYDAVILASQFPVDDGYIFFTALEAAFNAALKHRAFSNFISEEEEMSLSFSPKAFTNNLQRVVVRNLHNAQLLRFFKELETMPLTGMERVVFLLVLWQTQLDGVGDKEAQYDLRKSVADKTVEALLCFEDAAGYSTTIGNERLIRTLMDFGSWRAETSIDFFPTADDAVISAAARQAETQAFEKQCPVNYEARQAMSQSLREAARLKSLAELQAFGTDDAVVLVRAIRKAWRRVANLSDAHWKFLDDLDQEARECGVISLVMDRALLFGTKNAGLMLDQVDRWLRDYVRSLRADPDIPNPDESLADNLLVKLTTALSLSLFHKSEFVYQLRTQDSALADDDPRPLEKRALASFQAASVSRGLALAVQMTQRLPNGKAILANLDRSARALNIAFEMPGHLSPVPNLVVLHPEARAKQPSVPFVPHQMIAVGPKQALGPTPPPTRPASPTHWPQGSPLTRNPIVSTTTPPLWRYALRGRA